MPIKIKIFVSFLGLIAVSLIYFGISNLKLGQGPNFNKADTRSILQRDTDWDNDGLSNKDESYWNTDPNNPDTDGDGYLDGEEVASGHDPLKPGPDDKIESFDSVNITDKISTLIAAGYYAGDLKEDADPKVYNKAFTDITTEALFDGMTTLNPHNVSTGKIIISSDSKEAQEKYLIKLGDMIQVELWGQLINEPRIVGNNFLILLEEDAQKISEGRAYFNGTVNHYTQALKNFTSIPVPPSWIDIHKKILLSLQSLIINHKALGMTDKDPMKGALAFENLSLVYGDIPPILVSINQKIKENNLKPLNKPLWSLIGSLTDGL